MKQSATSKQVTDVLRRDHRLSQPAAKVQPLLCGCCCFLSFASHCLLVTDFLLYRCCNAAYCAVLRCCVALHRVVQLVYCQSTLEVLVSCNKLLCTRCAFHLYTSILTLPCFDIFHFGAIAMFMLRQTTVPCTTSYLEHVHPICMHTQALTRQNLFYRT